MWEAVGSAMTSAPTTVKGEGIPKKARKAEEISKGGGGSSSKGAGKQDKLPDGDILSALLRDHLFLRREVHETMDSHAIVFLFTAKEMCEKMNTCNINYNEKIPERPTAKDTKPTPHPLGLKKLFMFVAALRTLKELQATAAELQKDVLNEAIGYFSKMPPEELDVMVGSFKSKFKEPMDGRTWVWTLVLTPLCCEQLKKAITALIAITRPAKNGVVVNIRRTRQSQHEKELWKMTKKK
eukprot:TRINITY_DN102946_c0_g1_i1.p1 TRINITY_DN102946_c0_g1~~TRINITY_DN102946_c0_g1_i1.p1  ORF type:complete len:239 (-),score=67.59 TRINITY_DN102946_c0_g1_i1:331-1047(-)